MDDDDDDDDDCEDGGSCGPLMMFGDVCAHVSWARVIRRCRKQAVEAMARGSHVVVDNTSTQHKEYKYYQRQAVKAKAPYCKHHCLLCYRIILNIYIYIYIYNITHTHTWNIQLKYIMTNMFCNNYYSDLFI